MIEVMRSNDLVRLSWAQAVLEEAGIGCLVFDGHASVIEGSIGAIPRRLMVEDAAASRARHVLTAALREIEARERDR